MEDYKKILKSEEYTFLHTNKHLGRHMILLGLAGSYSYGTNVAESDIDIRGITLNQKSDLIGLTQFEQYVDDKTDTVIYAFHKMVMLLLNCNPNTIELLGLNPEHYLYLNDIGKLLLDNRKLFLSRKAIQSFGGYADAQLRRLQNALARETFPQSEKEQHIFNSVKNAMHSFNQSYKSFENGSMEIFIDKAVNPEMETEIFVNANRVKDYKIGFDEGFGVGTIYNSGEENMYLMDLKKLGYKLNYYPKVLAYHNVREKDYLDEKSFVAKGPVFKRLFGNGMGLVMYTVFTAKKFKQVDNCIKLYFKGVKEYFKCKL